MNFLTSLPIFGIIGFIALGIAVIYVQWKLGTSKQNESAINSATESIKIYETQVKLLREELAAERQGRIDDRHALAQEMTALKLKLAYLEGANEQKDIKIKEFTEIFQGRSPEQEQFMAEMRIFAEGVAKYMESSAIYQKNSAIYQKDSAEIFSGMKVFMTQLNNKADTNQARNQEIDKQALSSID